MTFHRLPGFSPDGSLTEAEGLTGMAGETDDPEDAAARLEAALERIAQHVGSHPAGAQAADGTQMQESADPSHLAPGDVAAPGPPVEEIAARLDDLIDRLRAALNASSTGGRPG